MKFGLKLWSTNLQNIEQAKKLYFDRVFDYVELFVVPESESYISEWKTARIPYILHAPHAYTGLNLSMADQINGNHANISLVNSYFNELNPEFVIFHPGISGTLIETIRQIHFFKKQYSSLFNCSLIENKPKIGIKFENCLGHTPEEISVLKNELGLGFCLDFGHAICSAASLNKNWKEVINSFLQLFPQMYHLSDGHIESPVDEHLHLGCGNYDLSWIFLKIDTTSLLTLETKRNNFLLLDDFVQDIDIIRHLHR